MSAMTAVNLTAIISVPAVVIMNPTSFQNEIGTIHAILGGIYKTNYIACVCVCDITKKYYTIYVDNWLSYIPTNLL